MHLDHARVDMTKVPGNNWQRHSSHDGMTGPSVAQLVEPHGRINFGALAHRPHPADLLASGPLLTEHRGACRAPRRELGKEFLPVFGQDDMPLVA